MKPRSRIFFELNNCGVNPIVPRFGAPQGLCRRPSTFFYEIGSASFSLSRNGAASSRAAPQSSRERRTSRRYLQFSGVIGGPAGLVKGRIQQCKIQVRPDSAGQVPDQIEEIAAFGIRKFQRSYRRNSLRKGFRQKTLHL